MAVTYLSGGDSQTLRAVAWAENIGFMTTPRQGNDRVIPLYPLWAADNGCFAQGDRFNPDRWLRWLERNRAHQARCLFAVAPDVLGDAAATTRRALPFLPQIRALGYPAAYVAQDGLTAASTPWGAFDVLFVGGTDAFKLGPAGAAIAAAARRRGVPMHMGRVNSLKRLRCCAALGIRSADGTFLAKAPDNNVPRLLRWLAALRTQPPLWLEGPHGATATAALGGALRASH